MKSLKTKKLILLIPLLWSSILQAEDVKPLSPPSLPIKLMADEWCPYNCAPHKEPGYTIEIFKEIFKNKASNVDYKIADWTMAIDQTRDGKNDVLVAATIGDAPDLIYPKEIIGLSRLCFYSTPSIRWKYKSLDSLKNIKLGVIKSYSYGDKLDNYIKDNQENSRKIDFTPGEVPLDELSKKLLSSRIDLIVENENVMNHYLKKSKQDKLMRNIGCEETLKVYMAFSPKNPNALKYSQEFDEGIKELRKSGKLKEILQKYSVSDWENPTISALP